MRLATFLMALVIAATAQTQPPAAASNPCRPQCRIAGLWNATYPGGPLRVQITQSGGAFDGVLLDGNEYVPVGKSTISGNYDGKAASFTGKQVCAYPGYTNVSWITVRFTFDTPDSFTEEVVKDSCGGFPVRWTRNTNAASGQYTVQRNGNKLDVSVDNTVLFDFNRSDLKASAAAVLAEIKRGVLDAHKQSKVLISGYTDDVGDQAYNLKLSEARARSVAQWMQSNGVSADRIVTKGFGKENPKVPNTDAKSRALNRRVEIELSE